MEILKVVKEAFVKEVQRAQVGDVLFVKVQVLDILNHLLQTGSHGKGAAARIFAVEKIEYGDAIGGAGLNVAVHHRHLV